VKAPLGNDAVGVSLRRMLEKHKLTASIFDTINKHLASKGFMIGSEHRNWVCY